MSTRGGCTFVCSYWQYVLVVISVFQHSSGDHNEKYLNSDSKNEEFCVRKDNRVECQRRDVDRLHRIDGDKLGTVTHIDVGGGRRVLDMLTANTDPLIFEIKGFLSDEECDHFVKVAKEKGLFDSVTNKGPSTREFQVLDLDGDRQLSLAEMRKTITNSFDIYLLDEDVLEMYKELNLDKNGDAFITQAELSSTSPDDMEMFLKDYLKKHPEKHSRMSSQVWYNPYEVTDDDIFIQVQNRVQKVVMLPDSLIRNSDFQIVRYGVKGHYNAHRDSSPRDKLPCCLRDGHQKCRTCRYMTVLFYLNDVNGGGETAFPTANTNQSYCKDFVSSFNTNLYEKCDLAKVKIKPDRGKAVIWYNHFVNQETGWLGDLDECTWHGGCPVKDGEKWIANFWIKAQDD